MSADLFPWAAAVGATGLVWLFLLWLTMVMEDRDEW
jgi:hypothetical protein